MKTKSIDRAEVETLCLRIAIRDGACTVAAVAERLGFARPLYPAVKACIAGMVAEGLLSQLGVRVALTSEAERALALRLDELRVT